MTVSAELSPASHATANNAVIYARAVRDFGDGFMAILLPVYLSTLGYSATAIGAVAASALFGSALLTILIGLIGNRHDYRLLLLAASGLMIATGIAYASVHDLALLLVVAFFGTANPSAGNASIFVPLEHTVIARGSAGHDRTRIFARYGLVGSLCAAMGALASAAPDHLTDSGWDLLTSIRMMFVLYALLGILGALLYARIPRLPPAPNQPRAVLGPSRGIVYRLAALFSLDSFASGFTVRSLLALWLFTRFDMSLAAAGLFFFWAGLISAASFPVAAWLSRRIGLINTMVFTHIPSSIALAVAAFAPTLEIALGLLSINMMLSQMDQPARASFVMAVVTVPERPAAASFTAVPRALATAAAPGISGALFAASYLAAPILIGGVLRIVYDVALLFMFRHVKPPEER